MASLSRRVLICGDVNGNLKKLYEDVTRLQEKHGNFDFLLCCGKFLPTDKDPDFQSYIAGQKQIPIMTYFVDSESMTFCTHCGTEAQPLGSSGKLFFLGTHGVKDIQGVRVAYLSGKMPQRSEDYHATFRNKQGEPAFGSNYYNAGVIEKLKSQKGVGIDILVTSEWPANVMEGTDLPPQIAFSSTAVAEVADALEPRFHACALANRFLRRQSYVSSNSKIVCRLIGLGIFDKQPDIQPQKSIHALIVCPFEKAKATLYKDAEKSTPCPFANVSTPVADRWQTRKNGDLVIRSTDGQNWTVHRDVVSKASTSFAQRVKTDSGTGIAMKEAAEVVEPFLQYLYRNSIDPSLPVPVLIRLLILADKEEIEFLAEECNRMIGENKDFPLPEQIVEIVRLLKNNKALQYCRRWYTRVLDTIKTDDCLLHAIVETL
eukprot:GEMP01064058.1.p1 GENE.GEMP01064058.1~~GEMP01064058.1.p1  ORF type:complete len:439 (-),score=75.24 GEMP01064058.1:37-1329(-)